MWTSPVLYRGHRLLPRAHWRIMRFCCLFMPSPPEAGMTCLGRQVPCETLRTKGEGMKVFVDAVARILRQEWVTLLLLAGVATAWLMLRTHSSGASSVEEFQAKVRGGSPVVAEFYSNS
jgi:hypothetical protein